MITGASVAGVQRKCVPAHGLRCQAHRQQSEQSITRVGGIFARRGSDPAGAQHDTQPGARLGPIASDGTLGRAQCRGRILLGVAGEEAAVDHLRQALVDRGEPFDGFMHFDEGLVLDARVKILIQCLGLDPLAAFRGKPIPRVIDQHVSHGERGGAQKMCTVVEERRLDQFQIRFRNQRGSSQGLARAHAAPLALSNALHFLVQQWKQLFSRAADFLWSVRLA